MRDDGRPPDPPGPLILTSRRFPLSLLVALALYVALAATTVRQVGVVGEVDLSWALGAPPQALTAFDPLPTWADGRAAPTSGDVTGPLVASRVRPVESLAFGAFSAPVAVNMYTGGLADWPARALWLLTGSRAAVTALHVLLGGVLIVLVHRFLRFRGTDVAAACAALFLATDWSFLFYRKVLGGTELQLSAATLLCLWALWSRRWGGNRHGLWALGVGIGLGLSAKLTFGLTLLALFLATLVMRWDRPRMNPPRLEGLIPGALAVVLLTAPLWVTWLHHGSLPGDPPPTHDFPQLQLRRVAAAFSGGPAPAREGLANLWIWLSEPLAFFGPAYGVQALPGASPWRLVGWFLLVAGVLLGWRDRHPTPHLALLRFTSVALLLQLGLLWLVARDLHHLAQTVPLLAIVVGLSLDGLASLTTPPRSFARARTAAILVLPWMVAGVLSLRQTDRVVQQITVPTFTEQGQEALVAMLREHGVRRLVLSDYESYGMLEIRAPEVDIVHAWPVAARQGMATLPDLLQFGAAQPDTFLLVVQASQPMGYNLRPDDTRLQEEAERAGVVVTPTAELTGGRARLYRLSL